MIADKIKILRKTHNLTQTNLAKKLGITRSSVNAWEMGLSIPSTQYIIELASLFKISTDYLLDVKNTASLSIDGLNEKEIKIVSELITYLSSSKN